MNKFDTKVLVALDYPSKKSAMSFIEKVSPEQCGLKVGKELFVSAGPEFVREIVDCGFKVFLDLKFHDIPNTVASACKAACDLGVWMLNVHTLGGRKMMQMAKDAVESSGTNALLIGVTILTSHSESDINEVGISGSIEERVGVLANMASESGLDGVVCSAHESRMIKELTTQEFLTVTPGIRLAGGDTQDQQRVMTPVKAIESGSDFLVIGRSVTQSDDPYKTLLEINSDLQKTQI